MNKMNWRMGILFSIDALLASLILIAGLLLIIKIADRHSDTTQLTLASQDVLSGVSTVKLQEINDPWVVANTQNGTMNANLTALEQIGTLWALGDITSAQHLASILLDNQYPGLGLRLQLEGTTIYERNGTKAGTDVITSSRMISGVASGQALTGSSSVAYLRRVKDKRTLSFTTFGGFVGQGNVSVKIIDLPSDANITSISLVLSTGAPFTLRFNGIPCGATYTPTSFNGTPTGWDISACNTSFVPGAVNNVSINFTSGLNASYITGGFLRIQYKTSTLGSLPNSTIQYLFPGINGIVNLYDAFYVPGTLLNMSVYLHYNASNNTYFDIGEKRVWQSVDNGTDRVVILNDSYLKDPAQGRLDYTFLSNKTVPIRMSGFDPIQTIIASGDADVVLITDFSGSMKKAVGDWSQGNLGSTCANAFTDSSVRRTLLAQCVDNDLVGTVMNYSGNGSTNRVWPVFIFNDQMQWYNNPNNMVAIEGYINSYSNGQGKTCLACAMNTAYDILKNLSNSSRKKFVVLMTDGCPTHCAQGSCTSSSEAEGAQQCAGLCDISGSCGSSDIPGACAACTSNPGAQANLYWSANRTHADLNATIFTVGFGPITDCAFGNTTLAQVAALGNGSYQQSNDSSKLKLIYDNISQEILSRTSLVAQVANITGNGSRSRLYSDSYINITYDIGQQYLPSQNTISLTLQTNQSCTPVVPLYPEQQLIEANAISYSGVHWSDFMSVNNVEAFNLSNFLVPYSDLGDPTIIHAPNNLLTPGNNTFILQTGDAPQNRTGCFANDSVIYTVIVNLSTERSVVVPNATGCKWLLQFEDDTFDNLTIPSTYGGTKLCSYRAGNLSYDPNDAYQLGAYTIFNRLDFKKDGKLFVNLQASDLEVIVTTISQVPYLWGPSTATLQVTR